MPASASRSAVTPAPQTTSANTPTNTATNTPASTSAADGQIRIDDQITVTSRRIACDGGGGALGHPRVWLNLGEDNRITCPYCSRDYVLADDAASDGAGSAAGH